VTQVTRASHGWDIAGRSTSISAWTPGDGQYNRWIETPAGAQFRIFRGQEGTDVAPGRLPRPDRVRQSRPPRQVNGSAFWSRTTIRFSEIGNWRSGGLT